MLVGVVGWYLLFGSCGWVNSAIAIRKMNQIADAWQDVRSSALHRYENDGHVGDEMGGIMQSWRDLIGSTHVPACLKPSRDALVSAIETDYHALFVGDESLLNAKHNMLEDGEQDMNIYRQNIMVVNACMPLCNLDQDMKFFE